MRPQRFPRRWGLVCHILWRMAHIIFRCPETLIRVQHWMDDDDSGNDVSDDACEMVGCPACSRVHLINRKTGNVLGEK